MRARGAVRRSNVLRSHPDCETRSALKPVRKCIRMLSAISFIFTPGNEGQASVKK
jgi:hypothetical protein